MISLAIKESGKEWVLVVQGKEFGSSKNRFDVDHAYNMLRDILLGEGVKVHDARDRVGTMPAVLGAPYGVSVDIETKGLPESLLKKFWDTQYAEQEKP